MHQPSKKNCFSFRQNKTLIKGDIAERSCSGFDSLFDPFALLALFAVYFLGIIIALNNHQLMELSLSVIDFHQLVRRIHFCAMLSNFSRKHLHQNKTQLKISHEIDALIDVLTSEEFR